MNKRTFIAININPTEELLRRIYYLKNNLKSENINWIKDQNFHITLRFIGDTPIGSIDRIASKLESGLKSYPNFDLQVKGISIFGSKHQPKVIWAGLEPVDILNKMALSIDEMLLEEGFKRDRQNFVPHLTIARIRKLKNKSFFHQVLNQIDQSLIQKQKIDKIVFYESLLKSTGAEYNIMKEIELKD